MSRGLVPLALITLGVVVLLGNVLPDRGRGGLIVLGLATAGGPGRLDIAPGLGASPFADTVRLEAPLSAGQTFSVTNSSGSTMIRGSADSLVHVVAMRHGAPGGQAPEVSLTPTDNGVLLGSSARGGVVVSQ